MLFSPRYSMHTRSSPVEGVGVWGLRVWGCEGVMGESVRVCEGEKNV